MRSMLPLLLALVLLPVVLVRARVRTQLLLSVRAEFRQRVEDGRITTRRVFFDVHSGRDAISYEVAYADDKSTAALLRKADRILVEPCSTDLWLVWTATLYALVHTLAFPLIILIRGIIGLGRIYVKGMVRPGKLQSKQQRLENLRERITQLEQELALNDSRDFLPDNDGAVRDVHSPQH